MLLLCFNILSGYGIAIPVQLANSSHIIVAFTTKLCHVLLGFLDHLQRPSNNGLIVKEFDGHSIFSTISSIVECRNGNLKNQLKKVSDFLSLIFSWSTYLSKAIWSLNVAVWRRIYSSWPLLVSGHDKRSRELYIPILKIWDSTLDIPGFVMCLFSLTANPGQLGWYALQVGGSLGKRDLGHDWFWTILQCLMPSMVIDTQPGTTLFQFDW